MNHQNRLINEYFYSEYFQEAKIKKYRQRLVDSGIPVTDDEDDDDDSDSDAVNNK